MKRFKGIYFALVLILSLFFLVSCANNDGSKVAIIQEIESLEPSSLPVDSLVDAQEMKDEKAISSYKVSFIDTQRSGNSGFENTFICSPGNGKTLNVNVKNTNKSGTVIFKVLKDTQDFEYVDVSAGKTVSRTFTMVDGSGMSGDWKVYATTRDGHAIDINVNAGQY